jgi:DNA-binding PadR family transcriptional regulator
MSLSHAILSLLVSKPRSGYDLTKAFDGSIGFFWKATHQQIYRELTKLEEQNCVTAEAVVQQGRPDKKLYSITETGQQQLTQWIALPCDVMPVKDEILVKTFVGQLVSPSVLQQELERHRQIHQDKLAMYQQIETEMKDRPSPDISDRFQYLVLRRGIRYEADCVGWCDEALAMLAERSPDSLLPDEIQIENEAR